MKRKALILSLVGFAAVALFSFVAVAPDVANAQPLVPCSGPDCQACHLIQLADNVIKFLMTLSVVAATIAFVWAGFLYLTAAANPTQIEKAHKIFWNVLVGLVIVLAAFLIVDTIMRVLTGQNLSFRSQILCVDQPESFSSSDIEFAPNPSVPNIELPSDSTPPSADPDDFFGEEEAQQEDDAAGESGGNQTI